MNTKSTAKLAPDALILLSSHCAHCPSVLDSLSKMIKTGSIGSLKVINLEKNPDTMQKYNIRSVPWVRIGKHELTGSQPIEALQQRAKWALNDLQEHDLEEVKKGNSVADFDFLLSDGQVDKVIQSIQETPENIQFIMQLLGDSGTILSSRIGIGVVFEELADSALLKALIPQLAKLSQHSDQRIRADAYHYLGMTGDSKAIAILESGKKDKDKEVREIVADSLEVLLEQF
ncbi:MAG TPA: HEAT repeat domain-containing protein [Leucothrix sp.]|nr:HEAT repeat domain-containing protein [Leucothrix sp.]